MKDCLDGGSIPPSSTKKRILKIVLIVLLVILSTYLIIGFILFQFNLAIWPISARIALVIITGFLVFMIFLFEPDPTKIVENPSDDNYL